MLSSPRRPSSTIRIFSSACEYQVGVERLKIDRSRREIFEIDGHKVVFTADLHAVSGEVEQCDFGILRHDGEGSHHFIGRDFVEIYQRTIFYELEPDFLQSCADELRITSR